MPHYQECGEKCINFEISFGEQKEKVYTFNVEIITLIFVKILY